MRWDLDVGTRGYQRAGSMRLKADNRSPDGGGSSTPRGAVSIRGIFVLVLGLLELQIFGRLSGPEMRLHLHRSPLDPRDTAFQRSPDGVGLFYTVRVGVDPENRRFCPRLVGVVEIHEDRWTRDGTLSSSSAGERWRYGLIIPVRHQPSSEEERACAKGVIDQSLARIVIQNSKSTARLA